MPRRKKNKKSKTVKLPPTITQGRRGAGPIISFPIGRQNKNPDDSDDDTLFQPLQRPSAVPPGTLPGSSPGTPQGSSPGTPQGSSPGTPPPVPSPVVESDSDSDVEVHELHTEKHYYDSLINEKNDDSKQGLRLTLPKKEFKSKTRFKKLRPLLLNLMLLSDVNFEQNLKYIKKRREQKRKEQVKLANVRYQLYGLKINTASGLQPLQKNLEAFFNANIKEEYVKNFYEFCVPSKSRKANAFNQENVVPVFITKFLRYCNIELNVERKSLVVIASWNIIMALRKRDYEAKESTEEPPIQLESLSAWVDMSENDDVGAAAPSQVGVAVPTLLSSKAVAYSGSDSDNDDEDKQDSRSNESLTDRLIREVTTLPQNLKEIFDKFLTLIQTLNPFDLEQLKTLLDTFKEGALALPQAGASAVQRGVRAAGEWIAQNAFSAQALELAKGAPEKIRKNLIELAKMPVAYLLRTVILMKMVKQS